VNAYVLLVLGLVLVLPAREPVGALSPESAATCVRTR
jgi:hypothetical protein